MPVMLSETFAYRNYNCHAPQCQMHYHYSTQQPYHGSTILSYAIRSILSISDIIHNNNEWAIHTLHCPENGGIVAQAIIGENAIAVSEGSYKDYVGTACCLFPAKWKESNLLLHPQKPLPHSTTVPTTIQIGCESQFCLIAVFEHV
jgi:hypothetical protein